MTGPFTVEMRASGPYVVVGKTPYYGPCDGQYEAECKADELNAAWRAAGGPELIEMLRSLEWSRPVRGIGDTCPVCDGVEDGGGHKPDCTLAALLARYPKETT